MSAKRRFESQAGSEDLDASELCQREICSPPAMDDAADASGGSADIAELLGP